LPEGSRGGLMVLGLVPWLAPIVKAVEVPGFGKLELQDLERKTQDATGAAESATQQVRLALALLAALRAPAAGVMFEKSRDELGSLATEYDHIRATQRAGESRTVA